MVDPRLSRFWRLALQSGLLDVRDLSACWESIPLDRREAIDHIDMVDRRLARQAIQEKLITLWQAQQLLAGRFNGFKVGRYVLLDLIGQGGMGRVYLAKDTRLTRTVALKILSADRMKNPRAIARFQREAKLGAQLQHENLVRIYDFGESDGRHYLVMEFIEGRTLGALISQQGPIPPSIAAGLGRQIALGLEHAHKKGLVHRDVNPYNIMVTYDGTAKLADLGLALDLADADRFTRDGATVGTFDYVSPEQARHSHSVDIRSDIYSLGCTLYHTIASEVPFPSSSLPEKLFAHMSVEPTPLDQVIPDIPEGLAEGIGRMMRKNPDERYSTPLQVAQMLEPFADVSSRNELDEQFRQYSEQQIRTKPDAKTLMIPRVVPDGDRGTPTGTNPAPDHQGTEPLDSTGALVTVDQTSTASQKEMTNPSRFEVSNASDPDLPLFLDLGPEPSLSEVLAESRKRSKSRMSATTTTSGIWSPKIRAIEYWQNFKSRFSGPALLGGLFVALAVSAGTLGGFIWMLRPNPESAGSPQPGRGPARDSGITPGTQPVASLGSSGGDVHANPKGSPATAKTEPATWTEATPSPILMRPPDGTGPDVPCKTLNEAINKAVGSRGMVVLRNRTPLVLNNNSVIQLNVPGKLKLLIRAEEGFEPVLEIAFNRLGSFLRGGPDLSLELEGLSIQARATSAGSAQSAIFQTAGPLTIRRCRFNVAPNSSHSAISAVYADGGSLNIERSQFEGFDRAIEIRMYRRLTATIRQTLITADARHPENQWGFKVSHIPLKGAPGNPDSLQLLLDHCTVQGGGLLALSGYSELTPLKARVSDCIIRADALINWDSRSESPTWPKALSWTGRGNQFQIKGKRWILNGGAAADGIVDAMTWAKQFEESQTSDGTLPGANPALIGPSSPVKR